MTMPLRERVAAVVEELKRLKREGVTAVSISDEAVAQLRTALAATSVVLPQSNAEAPPPPPPPAARASVRPPAPSPRASGDASTSPVYSGLVELVKSPAASTTRPVVSAATSSSAAKSSAAFPPAPVIALPPGSKREQWEWLRRRVLDCPVCRAHTHGENQVVFGVGNIDADIFFCGEAPGGEEEIQGEPFVGPAGNVLTRMIVAMGLTRPDVYIGNILNWRPEMEGRASGKSTQQTGNRPPTEAEMNFCLPYLRAQVAVVQPKVIVALGSTAAQGLLGFGSFKSLGSIRGQWLEYQGTPLMVTYHPSYLLRYADAKTKRIVWEDMLQVMEKVGLPITEKQRGFFK